MEERICTFVFTFKQEDAPKQFWDLMMNPKDGVKCIAIAEGNSVSELETAQNKIEELEEKIWS